VVRLPLPDPSSGRKISRPDVIRSTAAVALCQRVQYRPTTSEGR